MAVVGESGQNATEVALLSLKACLHRFPPPVPQRNVPSSDLGAVSLEANPGSLGHPELCRRPCIYLLKGGACHAGHACNFCHLTHCTLDAKLDQKQRRLLQKMSPGEMLATFLPHFRSRADETGLLHQAEPLIRLMSLATLAKHMLEPFSEEVKEAFEALRYILIAYARHDGVPDPPDKDFGDGWYKIAARESGEQKNTEPICSRDQLQALEMERQEEEDRERQALEEEFQKRRQRTMHAMAQMGLGEEEKPDVPTAVPESPKQARDVPVEAVSAMFDALDEEELFGSALYNSAVYSDEEEAIFGSPVGEDTPSEMPPSPPKASGTETEAGKEAAQSGTAGPKRSPEREAPQEAAGPSPSPERPSATEERPMAAEGAMDLGATQPYSSQGGDSLPATQAYQVIMGQVCGPGVLCDLDKASGDRRWSGDGDQASRKADQLALELRMLKDENYRIREEQLRLEKELRARRQWAQPSPSERPSHSKWRSSEATVGTQGGPSAGARPGGADYQQMAYMKEVIRSLQEENSQLRRGEKSVAASPTVSQEEYRQLERQLRALQQQQLRQVGSAGVSTAVSGVSTPLSSSGHIFGEEARSMRAHYEALQREQDELRNKVRRLARA
ncbi:RBCMT [Symbiodinium sp. CCMP2456]|nr:RBCMT [Symbiodinium sp. CCMP2456]